jgi:ribosomal protein S18 acetylase RimI-like enzyme
MVKAAASALRIRPATEEDAERIHSGIRRIAEHLGEEDKITSTVEDIRRHGFGEEPAFKVLIAEMDGAFAGLCLYFKSFSTWRGTAGAYIQDIVVEPQFRGAGIGKALLWATARSVKEQGGRYLRLSVDADNPGAQAFYRSNGLTHRETEKIHAAYDASFEALAEAGKTIEFSGEQDR